MPRPSERPRVGVTLSPHSSPRSRQNYLTAVGQAGLEAVALDTDDDGLLEMLSGLGGLVLSGGGDLNPALYGEETRADLVSVDHQRDRFETKALQTAIGADLPVLAICRGHQLANVALGGRLEQHIDSDAHRAHAGLDPGANSAWHSVTIDRDSRLHEVYGSERITTNSRHHQGIRPEMLAPGLRATAWSGDGYVEGYEDTAGRWLLGLQWHPERVEADARDGFNEQSARLFQYFAEIVGTHQGALVRQQ